MNKNTLEIRMRRRAKTLVCFWEMADVAVADYDCIADGIVLLTTVKILRDTDSPCLFVQPDFPRALVIKGVPAGATPLTGNVVISGFDINQRPLTETIALNDSTQVDGLKAFWRISRISYPVRKQANDAVDVGFKDVFGLPDALPGNQIIDVYVDGVRETTAPTVTFSSTVVASNTFDPNTAADNTRDFLVNYWKRND